MGDIKQVITKKEFIQLVKEITDSNKAIPEDFYLLLRDKDGFKKKCKSHYKSGNYVDVFDNLILDINYNKEKRREIFDRLRKMK